MITIIVYGLDQYAVGHYSLEHTKNLAQLFEVNEDDIMFVSSDAYVFHNGVEQTSWNTIMKIELPEKYEPLEEKVAKYIQMTTKEIVINLSILFSYYHSHHEHVFINKEYPHFMKDENLVHIEEDDDEDDELFTGNVFEGVQEQLDKAYEEKECECGDHCECGEHCECEDHDECECEEGHECHCGHHH